MSDFEQTKKSLTADDLENFLNERMRMSHVYQPLLIRTLLKHGGSASVREIAREFLKHDESQIEYYEQIAKNMPIPVLRRHAIVQKTGNEVQLLAHLTPEQCEKIAAICDAKVDEYKERRGTAIWQHRAVGLGAVPGSVRYEVLKRAQFRCDLCGVPASERALEIDHIKPRKHGGTDELENLQALCWKCNSGKGANDSTDFRELRRSAEPNRADMVSGRR